MCVFHLREGEYPFLATYILTEMTSSNCLWSVCCTPSHNLSYFQFSLEYM